MNNESYSLYDILEVIRKRPGMFIGDVSLHSLWVFLTGYQMAMRDAEINDISKPEFHGFHEFVRKQYNFYESTAGWANMILAIELGHNAESIVWESYDEKAIREHHENSLKTFFELLDDFKLGK